MPRACEELGSPHWQMHVLSTQTSPGWQTAVAIGPRRGRQRVPGAGGVALADAVAAARDVLDLDGALFVVGERPLGKLIGPDGRAVGRMSLTFNCNISRTDPDSISLVSITDQMNLTGQPGALRLATLTA